MKFASWMLFFSGSFILLRHTETSGNNKDKNDTELTLFEVDLHMSDNSEDPSHQQLNTNPKIGDFDDNTNINSNTRSNHHPEIPSNEENQIDLDENYDPPQLIVVSGSVEDRRRSGTCKILALLVNVIVLFLLVEIIHVCKH